MPAFSRLVHQSTYFSMHAATEHENKMFNVLAASLEAKH